jgi:hypothetical protein
MKTIIAGSRSINEYALVERAIRESGFSIKEVVSGGAAGADQLGEKWARKNGIPVKPFPADWERYGKTRAGFIRNSQMARYADALIAVWDGKSSGTADMIQKAKAAGLKVSVVCTDAKLQKVHQEGVPVGQIVSQRSFHQVDMDCEALIIDLSNDDELRIWFGVYERPRWGGAGTVTFRDELMEACSSEKTDERYFGRQALLQTATESLTHEIQYATDRFYPDCAEREIY